LRYLSCATNSFIGPPHLVLDPQDAAGILPKSTDERKRGEVFPQSRSTIKIGEPNEAIPLDGVHRLGKHGGARTPWPGISGVKKYLGPKLLIAVASDIKQTKILRPPPKQKRKT